MSNHHGKRPFRVLTALIGLTALLTVALIGGFTLGLFDRTAVPDPLRVENRSKREFVMLGLRLDDRLLLHKTESEAPRQAVFPKSLLKGVDSVQLLGIGEGQQLWLSQPMQVKEEKLLLIQSADELSDEVTGLLAALPGLEQLKLQREGQQLLLSYAAGTGLHYRVTVLGKGGQLSSSDWGTAGSLVQASWERGRAQMQGWLEIRE